MPLNAHDGADATRQIVGIFFDANRLRGAVDALLSSGFQRAELGLLAQQSIVEEGEDEATQIHAELTKGMDESGERAVASISRLAGTETMNALFGGLGFVGVVAAGGAVVALAGVLGGTVAPAVASAVAVGSAGAVFSRVVKGRDNERLEEEAEKGHLILLVRVQTAQREQDAVDILNRHSAYDVRRYDVPAEEPVTEATSRGAA